MLGFSPTNQRTFAPEQLDQRLRAGLVGHWIGGGSGLTWFDQSGYGNHGARSGGAVIGNWTLGRDGKRAALAFDGISDQVVIPSIQISANKTVCAWLKFAATPDVVLLGGASTHYNPYIDDTYIYLRAGGSFSSIAHNGITLGQWYHIAVTGDGTTATAYKNGVSLGTLTDYSALVTSIGAYAAATNSMNGVIDDVRIYNNRILSSAEIALLADPAFSPVIQPNYRIIRRRLRTTLPVPAGTCKYWYDGQPVISIQKGATASGGGKYWIDGQVNLALNTAAGAAAATSYPPKSSTIPTVIFCL